MKYNTLSDGDFRARRAYFTKVARGRSAGAAAAAGQSGPGGPGAGRRRIQDAGIELSGLTKRFLTPADTADALDRRLAALSDAQYLSLAFRPSGGRTAPGRRP